MDSWSDLQLAMMRNGGNAKLRTFFENYKIPQDKSIDFKYRTKAGVYYRDMLKALSEGKPLPNPPTLDEGCEIVPTKQNVLNPNNITGFGSTPNPGGSALDNITLDGVKDGVVTLGSTIANGTKNLASKINEKVSDPNFKEDVKGFGVKVATTTKDGAVFVADKTKEVWQNRDEYIEKTTELAKQGYSVASGLFKKLWGSGDSNTNANGNNQI